MAANRLARFCADYHGDLYTLRMAVTRLAMSEHHLALREIAHTWQPRNDFHKKLKQIALRSVPLSVPRNMCGPAERVCKLLMPALGIKTQEQLNEQTRLERAEWWQSEWEEEEANG